MLMESTPRAFFKHQKFYAWYNHNLLALNLEYISALEPNAWPWECKAEDVSLLHQGGTSAQYPLSFEFTVRLCAAPLKEAIIKMLVHERQHRWWWELERTMPAMPWKEAKLVIFFLAAMQPVHSGHVGVSANASKLWPTWAAVSSGAMGRAPLCSCVATPSLRLCARAAAAALLHCYSTGSGEIFSWLACMSSLGNGSVCPSKLQKGKYNNPCCIY